MASVFVVVPCFNEADRLDRDAFERAELRGHQLRLHFVDDGSTDGTGEVLEELCAQQPSALGFSQLPENVGKAEAVRHGLSIGLAEGHDYVGFWDADLATPMSELVEFVRVLEDRTQVDVVLGARVALLGRRIDRRLHRHLYGRVFATAVSQTLALPVYDTQCGAKLFRANADLQRVLDRPFLSRWIFDVELLARYIERYEARGVEADAKIYELALRRWRDVPGSKVRASDAARAFLELSRIAREYRTALTARRIRL